MAKLSAHGRTVLARVEKVQSLPSTTRFTRNEERAVRTELVLCSDGAILRKRTWLNPDGTVDFGDGWKVKGRLKEGLKPGPSVAERWVNTYVAAGYTRKDA